MWVYQFSSVAQSCPTLRPHGLQHARPPCPPPTPVIYSNSCPLSKWCHPTISSSFIPFASNLQSFPASGSFQMSQLFASSGQSIWSFSFNISPSNEHPGLISFRMNWLDPLGCMHIHFKICTCLFLDFLWIKRLFKKKKEKKTGFHSWMKIPFYLFIREEKVTIFFLPCYQRVLRILCWEEESRCGWKGT